ncbi:type VI secretion system Vgr family protein [Paraburkholderia caribensis]|uniref:type VI secretion system Vgr family protein n=1 Tax=Paraburkholderia caribensis TaxID=75105 RepID=UPI001CAEE227|nr:type VI secretion system tip protein TssI/VgrG [Paraburkholderia caribensis]CAG9255731.1 Type VI secretion system spike protein VgrG1a [Paraburkholderia caribensis]
MLTFVKSRIITMSGPALPVSPLGEPALETTGVAGEEALSAIYAYTLSCRTPLEMPESEAANLDLKQMIGKELTVTIQLEGMGTFVAGMQGMAGASNIGAGTREISGIVTEARYVSQSDRQSNYELALRPWIWLADQTSDYRIFQRKTVVEIIEDVFGKYMYSYDLRLSGSYPVLDYQVQYGETDFYFIQRLMAEHGIYWFFEHSGTFHRMVLVDHLGAHRPVESTAYQTLWYYPPGHRIDQEYIDAFDMSGALQSGRWTTNDYDFKKPMAGLIAQNELPQETAHNDFERYEWPGDYTEREHGEQFARLRMEEVRAHGERASGSGQVRDVVCGTTFRLEGYPHRPANREYLVISAWFSATEIGAASGSGEYTISSAFVVQPATTVFRPSRTRYPKPRTSGPQTAIVTGPAGQEIWTDQYGRVKLGFHWDRSGVKDQNASCWIRVSYPWAGGGFGGVNIPRVGTEVIVDFENGDPDRPIVVGRLYNAATMPPWDLPGNATQSGLLSRSLKGGAGNANAIRFEDKPGSEELWLQAEKDMRTEVENDESHSVMANRTKSVGGNETTSVAGTRTETVTGNETITLNANRERSVKLNDTVEIGADQKTTITGKQRYEVKSDRDRIVGGNDTLKVTGFREEEIAQTSTETVHLAKTSNLLTTHTVKVTGHQLIQVGSGQEVHVTGDVVLTSTTKISLVCGNSQIVMDAAGNINITGVNVTSTGSSTHAVNGSTVTSSATGEHTVQGAVLKLNP